MNSSKGKNSFALIIMVLSIIGFIISACSFAIHLSKITTTSIKKEEHKISGCYYITDSLTKKKDLTTSLCVNEDTTYFNYKNNGSVTLYSKWYGDNGLEIRNNYDERLFDCQLNKEDNNKMKCSSYNKALGSGTWVWEK